MRKVNKIEPSSLLENITPPIVDSFSSHGSQFKFREWCETEPTVFRSYPRRQIWAKDRKILLSYFKTLGDWFQGEYWTRVYLSGGCK